MKIGDKVQIRKTGEIGYIDGFGVKSTEIVYIAKRDSIICRLTNEIMPVVIEKGWISSIISDLRQKGRTNDELKEFAEAILDEAEK